MDFNNESDGYNFSWFVWCSCGDLSWCDLFCGGDMYGVILNNFFSIVQLFRVAVVPENVHTT